MDAPSAVLADVRYSLLKVEPEDMVEFCTPTLVEDDAGFVKVLLSSVSLDDEDANAESVLGLLAAVLGSETTVVDDAELVVEIELPPERGVCARELDDERSADCDDTPSVEADCEGFSTTSPVLTAELTICDVSNVTEKPEAGLVGCERPDASKVVLTVELGGPDRPDDKDVLAVKLVGCDELNVPEPSTVEVNCGAEL
jgi:hypothetical protein